MSDRATRSPPTTAIDRTIAVGLAGIAAVWHAMLMTRATNDNFLHLTLAQQWLHGDLPVRDFFDQGWVLQYSLSAVTHLLFGERLGSEAAIVAVAWAVSTYLVFVIVRRLSGSTFVAFASALLPIVASARGYSYPKGIVYAVAAWLWWNYVREPATRRAIIFGVWTAVAFYWRPDHGVYVAIGLVLATVAAHGFRPLTLTRCLIAGATTVACLLPFFLYVQLVYGLRWYAQTGLVAAEVEHESHGTHEWPLLRYGSRVFAVEPATDFAPTIGIRWRPDSSAAQREEVRSRYGLTAVGSEAEGVERLKVSADGVARVRALINEPFVDDTAGIDRAAGAINEKNWPLAMRRKFDHAILRLQVLPFLDEDARASEISAAAFLLLPWMTLAGAWWIARRLDVPDAPAVAAFSAFALLVAWTMIRNPFQARVADAVVLSSICFGCGMGALWRGARSAGTVIRRAALVAFAVAVIVTVGQSGRFESPLTWTRGIGDTYRELAATPPLSHYVDRPARFTLRLAAYVRDCVPESDRLLVLWFEPEIYYYSDRLMAQRHLVFAPAWSALEHEQRETLAKIDRFKPPIVLARRSSLDEYARATYPGVIAYVEQHYDLAATVSDAGEDYLIYAWRDRRVLRTFGSGAWPCYVEQRSMWSRVGAASP